MLTAAAGEAVRTLLSLQGGSTPLGAARAILELSLKVREVAELEARMSANGGRRVPLSTRLRRLETSRPRCDGHIRRLAPESHVPSDADRCRQCGGCHVLVIVEEIVGEPNKSEEVRI